MLPLQNVTDGFVIQDIDGLDPVKANIVSTGFAQMDGEQYQSSSLPSRNITLKLGLEASLYAAGSVRDLRNRLYKYLMPKSFVTLTFRDQTFPEITIDGYVESLDTKLFVKEPEATISILCMTPNFKATQSRTLQGQTVTSVSGASTTIDYSGTAPSGIMVNLPFNRAVTSFTLQNTNVNGETTSMEFSGAFASGDTLVIQTAPGDKNVESLKVGVRTPMLHTLSSYSGWISLDPGPNYFKVIVAGAAMNYLLTYTDNYGGL